jgi:hypothetical protein
MNPFFRVFRASSAPFAMVASLLTSALAIAQAPVLLPNTMSTAAGNVHALDFGATTFPFAFTADGASAIGATLNYPQFVGVDPKGEVYFHDAQSAVIRQIDDAGNLKTVAGTVPAAGCAPTNSSTAGATYTGTLNGVVYTAAPYCWNDGSSTSGNGNAFHNVTGGAATSSGFGMGYQAKPLAGPTFDSFGNMYIAETQGFYGVSVVYRGGSALSAFLATLYPTQTITPGNAYLLTGTSNSGYTANGTAPLTARFKAPGTVGVDSQGNLYIPDENGFVQVLNIQSTAIVVAGTSIPAGSVSTILGSTCVANSGCAQVSPTNNALASSGSNGTAGADVVTVDRWGNIYIANRSTGSSGTAVVEAIYAGAPNAVTGAGNPLYGMLNAIYPGLGSPTANFTYILSGGGTTAPSVIASPMTSWLIGAPNTTLGGSATGLAHGNIEGIAVDGGGNVYFTDTSKLFVWRIDAINGETAIVAGGGSKYSLASASFPTTQKCENNTTLYASSNLGDGCETTGIVVYGGNYGVAAGPAGDLYFTQGAADVLDKLSIGTSFPTTAVGSTSVSQRMRVHFYAGNLYAASNAFAIAGISSTEFAFAVTPTPLNICTKNPDASFDCVVTVTFKPVGTGLRQAQLIATDANGATHSFALNGLATGAQVTFDAGIGTSVRRA